MNGVKTGKVGQLENCKIDEEMWSQSEERLCKSIIKGPASRNRERHAMLAVVEEEEEQEGSYALTTSPARNCRGMQCAKLVNWN